MGRKVWFPVVSGPLAPYASGFGSWLRSRSYSPSAVSDRLWQFDQLSRWLEQDGLDVRELTVEEGQRFVAERRAAGRSTLVSPQSVMLPLAFLRELGLAPTPAAAAVQGPVEELLSDYGRYLLIERGLSRHTVFDAYVPAARLFLAARQSQHGLELRQLRPADVSIFLARECGTRTVSGRAGSGVCAALVAAIPASGRADRRAAGVGGPVGRRSA